MLYGSRRDTVYVSLSSGMSSRTAVTPIICVGLYNCVQVTQTICECGLTPKSCPSANTKRPDEGEIDKSEESILAIQC